MSLVRNAILVYSAMALVKLYILIKVVHYTFSSFGKKLFFYQLFLVLYINVLTYCCVFAIALSFSIQRFVHNIYFNDRCSVTKKPLCFLARSV